jgi:hypothetical protein
VIPRVAVATPATQAAPLRTERRETRPDNFDDFDMPLS